MRRSKTVWIILTLALAGSEEHTSELQSLRHLVCRLLLEKKNIVHVPKAAEVGRHHELRDGRRRMFDGAEDRCKGRSAAPHTEHDYIHCRKPARRRTGHAH